MQPPFLQIILKKTKVLIVLIKNRYNIAKMKDESVENISLLNLDSALFKD